MCKLCSIDGCSSKVHSRGWCPKHYRRWQRHGDPLREERTPAPALERVLRNSKKVGDCLEFQGNLSEWGYGIIKENGRTIGAHRVVARELIGDPEGLYVCHRCDNPSCVNYEHLFLGTSSDNAQDRENKGRGHDISGDNNPKRVFLKRQLDKGML